MVKFLSLHKALTMLSLRIAGYISSTLVSFTTGNRRDCILLWISPLILEDAEEIKIYMRVYYTYCRGRQNIIAEAYRAFSDSYFTVTRVYHHFHFVPALVTYRGIVLKYLDCFCELSQTIIYRRHCYRWSLHRIFFVPSLM